ncbi:MAG: hypothetical protein ACK5NG_03850 [Chthoniobacterales bacterium]
MKPIPATALSLAFAVTSFLSVSAVAADTLLETDFSDTIYYPSNTVLRVVNDGQGKWAFNSRARAVDMADGRRGINIVDTAYSLYSFPDAYSDGKITVEFSVVPNNPRGYFDIQLGNGTTYSDIGPQIRLGGNAEGDVTYYDGAAFVTIPGVTFTPNEVNTFKFTAYLSGEKSGKFDFYFNGKLVGENLAWRNDLLDLTTLRIRSTRIGQSCNLVGLTITHEE